MKGVINRILVLLSCIFYSGIAQAADNVGGQSFGREGVFAIAAALTIAIAVVGGAFAQGRAASSALEGIARNPEAGNRILTPMIIALALIESLVIYALVIAFILSGKI